MNIGKHGEGTHCTKMGGDSSAEKFILDFNEKRLHLVWPNAANGVFMNTFYRKLIQGDCTKNAALKCIILHKWIRIVTVKL